MVDLAKKKTFYHTRIEINKCFLFVSGNSILNHFKQICLLRVNTLVVTQQQLLETLIVLRTLPDMRKNGASKFYFSFL